MTMTLKDILEHCGFDSAFEFLFHHLSLFTPLSLAFCFEQLVGCGTPDQHQHCRPPAPDQKQRQTSSKLCAPDILSASCAPHFHLSVT